MSGTSSLVVYSVGIVCCMLVVAIVILRRRATTGLTLAFLVTFLVNYWLTSTLYAILGSGTHPIPIVASGTRLALIGAIGFTIGVLVLGPLLSGAFSRGRAQPPRGSPPRPPSGLILRCLFLGLAAYWATKLVPGLSGIPTFGNLVDQLAQLILIAMALAMVALAGRPIRALGLVLLIIVFYAAVGVVADGFLSFGAASGAVVFASYLALGRLSLVRLLIGAALMYLALSVFITYFANRPSIRASVWGGAPVSDRIGTVTRDFSHFIWFSSTDQGQQALIDQRLSLNYQSGLAIAYHNAGVTGSEGGATFLSALVAPIPRFLWPNKPTIAGSGDLVSKYTGQFFPVGTSVGIGTVFEGYINFGDVGVFVLLLLWGGVLSGADRKSAAALWNGDWWSFAIWYMAGLGFVNSASNSGEAVGASVLGVAAIVIVQRLLHLFPTPSAREESDTGGRTEDLSNPATVWADRRRSRLARHLRPRGEPQTSTARRSSAPPGRTLAPGDRP